MSTAKRGRFDIEADGLLDTVTKVHCLALKIGNEKAQLFVGDAIQQGLDLLDSCDTIVAHNGIAYDLMVLWKFYKWKPKAKVVDTFTRSCLVHPDIEGGHSLEEWGLRVGIPKTLFEGPWDHYTEAMGSYCLDDVATLVALDEQLMKDMEGWDWAAADHMEHQFAKDFAIQGMRGVKVDQKLCHKLVEQIDKEMLDIEATIEPLLPMKEGTKGQLDDVTPPKKQFKKDGTPSALCLKFFDEIQEGVLEGMRLAPGSIVRDALSQHYGRKGDLFYPLPWVGPLYTQFPAMLKDQQHIKTWLMDMGWKPTMWSFKKQKDAKGKMRFVRDDKGQLIPTWPKFHEKGVLCANLENINSDFPHVKACVRWIVIRHRRGIARGVLDALRPDGTVAATGFALATPTSRVAHVAPVANIPKAEPEVVLGKECRAIFVARPGRKFVGVDAAGLELRMLAHYVGSPELIKMVVEGTKENGTEIHTVLWKACDPLVPSRTIQKNVTYGWLYGASDKKLGQTAGHPDGTAEKAGKEIRKRMVAAIPGLNVLMKKIEAAAKVGYLKAMDGRKIEVRMKHATLNTLLQSAGSILVKWAQCYMNAAIRKKRLDAWQVISYHDEVQLDAHPAHAEQAGRLFIEGLQWAGRKFNVRCPLDGEVKVGNNWAETH